MKELAQDFTERLFSRLQESVSKNTEEDIWRASLGFSRSGYFVLVPECKDDEIYDFRMAIVNEPGASQVGMTPADLEGQLINEMFPVNVEEGHFNHYKKSYLTGHPYEREYEIPDGLPGAGRWKQIVRRLGEYLVIKNFPVEVDDDLDELKAELQKERTELLEKVIREAGHDLRTPMSVIKTSLYLSQMVNETDPEKSKQYQQQAKDQVNRLEEILEDLVDVAKMRDSGLNLQVMDASEFIEKMYDEFVLLVGVNNRQIELIKDSCCCVLISPDKMYRAIGNIIRNAITYSEQDDLITLTCTDENNNVRIIVRDTGIGISQENLDKIFDRFFRVDNTKASDEGNVGLGLSIANDIVKAHGGFIEVKSELGEWTEFHIVLPKVEPSA